MFNLLIAYNDEHWDIDNSERGAAAFPLSRFLEYTDPDLVKQLTPVTSSTLSSLEKAPCLFMSELYTEDEEEDGRDYVDLRVGTISNLQVENGAITYSFVIDKNFGQVVVPNRRDFESALGMGRLELYRTHWSVKDRDLEASLRQIGLHSDLIGPAGDLSIWDDLDSDETPRVESLEEFLRIVLSQDISTDDEVFYRGHSDKEYKLEPSLLRRNDKGGYRYLHDEATIVRELLTAQPAEFATDQYMIDKLVRMQHYGLPTRLLDVTSNPLVALYFCCSSHKTDKDGNEVEGEVIILSTKRSEVKFYDSDTVSCIANLALLSDTHKNRIDTGLGAEAFNESLACEQLLHNIRAEKPYFKNKIDPEDLGRIVFVRGRNSNSRISSQSGAFMLFGRDAILPETGHSSVNIQRIKVQNKRFILGQLDKLNIKSSTIYPGIEKAASEIAKKYEEIG